MRCVLSEWIMFCASTPHLFFIVLFDKAEHPLLVISVVWCDAKICIVVLHLELHCVTARCGGRVCHFVW